MKRITLTTCVLMCFQILSILPDSSIAIERISLSDVKASFVGEQEDDLCGSFSLIVGDINGDGFDDMLIKKSGPERWTRTFYFVLGRPYGWTRHKRLSESDGSIVGERELFMPARAGDVNGDGFDDILISAYTNDDGGKETGQTYLFLGSHEGFKPGTTMSEADASFIGEYLGSGSGFNASGAGDVNGDGYGDILIGAFNVGTYLTEKTVGRVYLIFGKPTGWSKDISLSDADVSFIGPASDLWSGCWVSGAGDVNNDGYDDILIAAHWMSEDMITDHQANVYVVFGKADGWTKDTPFSQSNLILVAQGWHSYLGSVSLYSGWMVGRAGDVNGDGYDDMLIAAPWKSSEAGQTYLIFGRPGDGGFVEIDLSTAADASFIGEHPGDWSGYSIGLGGGDFNGDGYSDILIGSFLNNGNGKDSGQTYLVFGKRSGWKKGVSLSQADISFVGEVAGDNSGFSSSIAGDVNGDGFNDVLISGAGNDYNAPNAGQAYLQCRQERKGDVNFDGEIDVADVMQAVDILLGIADVPPGRVWATDCTGDGEIDVLDIIYIVHLIAGFDDREKESAALSPVSTGE